MRHSGNVKSARKIFEVSDMYRLIYIFMDFICFSLIFLLGKHYPDGMVGFQSLILFSKYIVVLINYRKRYISKYFIIYSVCSCASQILLYNFLAITKIYNINNGPLSGGEFGLLFYYAILIIFNILVWITNIGKFIIYRLKKG